MHPRCRAFTSLERYIAIPTTLEALFLLLEGQHDSGSDISQSVERRRSRSIVRPPPRAEIEIPGWPPTRFLRLTEQEISSLSAFGFEPGEALRSRISDRIISCLSVP